MKQKLLSLIQTGLIQKNLITILKHSSKTHLKDFRLFSYLFSLVFVFSGTYSFAADTTLSNKNQNLHTKLVTTQDNKSVKIKKNKSKLSTQVDFNDHLVGGTYQKPLEAIAVVEDDKSIESLIGMRKNFDDRSKKMKELR